MASLFELPVIYIIENNGYSMGTSLERSSVFKTCLAERGEAFCVEWVQANGEDLYEVRAVTQQAIDRAHNESRPTDHRVRHLPLLRPLRRRLEAQGRLPDRGGDRAIQDAITIRSSSSSSG